MAVPPNFCVPGRVSSREMAEIGCGMGKGTLTSFGSFWFVVSAVSSLAGCSDCGDVGTATTVSSSFTSKFVGCWLDMVTC